MKKLVLALIVAAAGAAAAPGAASAAAPGRHARVHRAPDAADYNAAPPLTVQRRSYLDPGNVVPVGTTNAYVWAPALPGADLYESGGTAWRFGAGTLPGPFTVPGRQEPITNF